MNRNTIILTITLLLIIYSFANCQTGRHISIGLGPFAYLDPITPSLNIHVETKLYDKYRIDAAYGLDLNQNTWAKWHPNQEARHHEFKLGIKKMIASNNANHNQLKYVSIEYFSVLNKYHKEDDQYINKDERLLFDSAEISRNINGLRFKVGLQKSYKSFGIDLYGGGGIRYLNIVYNTINQRLANEMWEEGEWLSPIDQTAGGRLKLDLNIGFKIFYIILK